MYSNEAIRRLGDRLRDGTATDSDADLLEAFRSSFLEPCKAVEGAIRKLGYAVTSRPSKTRPSIVAKLRRQPTERLPQMQDIAGCRIVVANLTEQDFAVAQLRGVLQVISVIDRRERPSHGYRAVHLVVLQAGQRVEIQVRTRAQDRWAQFSEKLAERRGMDLKYGIGEPRLLDLLHRGSNRAHWVDHVMAEISPVVRIHPSSSIDTGMLSITPYPGATTPGAQREGEDAATHAQRNLDILMRALDEWFDSALKAYEAYGDQS
jgi:hypothetical protein